MSRDTVDLSDGCCCGMNPPCNFCCSLDELESEAYFSGGAPAVRALWDEREEIERLFAWDPAWNAQTIQGAVEQLKEANAAGPVCPNCLEPGPPHYFWRSPRSGPTVPTFTCEPAEPECFR